MLVGQQQRNQPPSRHGHGPDMHSDEQLPSVWHDGSGRYLRVDRPLDDRAPPEGRCPLMKRAVLWPSAETDRMSPTVPVVDPPPFFVTVTVEPTARSWPRMPQEPSGSLVKVIRVLICVLM